ncbi:MAG: phenylacetate--CoA ligase family protein [Gammaproteobacteria bacterium]
MKTQETTGQDAGPGRRFYEPAVETLPRADIAAFQERHLLGDVLPFACEHSPLLRETWQRAGVAPGDIGSMADFFAAAPFIDKEAIKRFRDERGDPYGGLLCRRPADIANLAGIFGTGGTTGEPTPVTVLRGPTVMMRDFWESGVRPGDHLSVVLFTFRGAGTNETVRGMGAVPLFFNHTPLEIPALLEFGRRFRPTGWYLLSNVMINGIEQMAPQIGFDPAELFASYRNVIYAGEPLGARARRLLDAWGVRILSHTAVGDVSAATECQARDGCHVWEDTVLVECLDPDGTAPVPDGERGELVVTSIIDTVAPVLRCRTDDLVRLTRAPCACGRTHARIWPLGRKTDEVLIDGRSVMPVDVWGAVETVHETRAGLFQVIRSARQMDRLRLRVGYQDARPGVLPALRTRLADAIGERLGLVPEIELVPAGDLLRLGPPHKIPRVAKR